MIFADRVKETTTTTGTGTYDLDGAVSGYQTFVAGGVDECIYSVTDGTDWEIGIGTVTDASPDTLSRDTILSSSNSGAAVSWSAGTKTVRLSQAASYAAQVREFPMVAVYDNSGQTVTIRSDEVITWDTELVDTHGFADLVSDNDRLAIPASMDGYWFVAYAMLRLNSTAPHGYRLWINQYDSGDTLLATVADQFGGEDAAGTDAQGQICVRSRPVLVSTGDYFKVLFHYDAGGGRSISSPETNNIFRLWRVSG